jgi:hypothetical protein
LLGRNSVSRVVKQNTPQMRKQLNFKAISQNWALGRMGQWLPFGPQTQQCAQQMRRITSTDTYERNLNEANYSPRVR